MGNFEVRRFDSAGELAAGAAEAWLQQVPTVKAGAPAYCVALAGGRIAGRFFEAVAAQAKTRALSLAGVHFFWSDERCVEPSSPESNFRLAREGMLDPLQIPKDHIHRIRGEDLPDRAAAAAEEELRRFAKEQQGQQPVLDLAFLGMGDDGHVASLFPPAPATVAAQEPVFRAALSPKPPPQRITMSYRTLAVACEVWVLVSGAGKESAFRKSLARQGTTPLAAVLRAREGTLIFTDILLD